MSTDHHRPFGSDIGGRIAERFARSFGTFTFILIQTVIVALWVSESVRGRSPQLGAWLAPLNVGASSIRREPAPRTG